MNHDPRKAIRQAMMIARREVTAPNKASIGGQRHMLAYITPYEAELLMRRGGSGRLTEYGVPAFDDGDGAGGGGDAANSEASTQDAAGGNAGEGAGPTGAGAGATGETGPDDTDASVSGNPAAVSAPTAPTVTAPFGTQGFGQAPSALGMGVIGTIGGMAMGVPGLGALGTAIGTGMDVEGLNSQLGMMGLQQNVNYETALAHNMSLGMLGKSATDQFGQTLGFDALAEAPMAAFSPPQGLPDAPADTSGGLSVVPIIRQPQQNPMEDAEMAQQQALMASSNPMQQPLMLASGGAATARMDPRSLPGIHLKTDHRFADGGGVQPEEEEGFDAYHGSPHEFEQFDSSKIGTGEGAQAFGYGHYLAENEGVARQYRNKLAPTTLVTQSGAKHAYSSSAADEIAGDLLKGASPQIRYPVEHALGLMMRGSALDSAISKMRNDYDHFDPKNLDEAESLLRQHNPDPISSGHMYHVRVKAKPEHFLDWDAPLSEQHPKVIEALQLNRPLATKLTGTNEDKTYSKTLGHFVGPDTTVSDIVESHKKSKDLSDRLMNAGIPGIKYFDQGSRRGGEGTRNYVVFHPKHLEIKRRYADGGEIMPPRDLGADPAVQRALDITRQAQPTAPQLARQVQPQARPIEENDINAKAVADQPISQTTEDFNFNIDRGKRKEVKAKLAPEDMEKINKIAQDHKLTPDEVEYSYRKLKNRFPASQWAPFNIVGVQKDNESVVRDAEGYPELKVQEQAYNFHKPKGSEEQRVGATDWDPAHLNRVTKNIVKAVRDVADREDAGDKNASVIMKARNWYRAMRDRLRQEYGGFADTMADMLGATSAQTGVRQNWDNTIEALSEFSRGSYDRALGKLQNWVDQGGEMGSAAVANGKGYINGHLNDLKAALPDAIKQAKEEGLTNEKQIQKRAKEIAFQKAQEGEFPLITKADGKTLFNANTPAAMMAFLDKFRERKAGDSPKTPNFTGNLIGYSDKATIDLWAARFLRRMAGMKPVPTAAESGVSGAFLAEPLKTGIQVGGEFGFGQQAFQNAAKELRKDPRFAGLGDDDLQAIVWFLEKEHWTKNDWTNKTGEGGSFEQEANFAGVPDRGKLKELRYQAENDATASDRQKISDFLSNKAPMEAAQKAYDENKWILDYATSAKQRDAVMDRMGITDKAQAVELAKNILGAAKAANNTLQKYPAAEQRLGMLEQKSQQTRASATQQLNDMQAVARRFVGGLSPDREENPATPEMFAEGQSALGQAINSSPSVMMSKATPSRGRYIDPEGNIYDEKSYDLEFVTRQDFDPASAWQAIVNEGKRRNQQSVFLSEVVPPGTLEGANPGIEVYFKKKLDDKATESLTKIINELGVDAGYTFVTDFRAKDRLAGGAPHGEYVGLRLQYIPEFGGGVEGMEKAKDDMIHAIEKIAKFDGVSNAKYVEYDTQVAMENEYERHLAGHVPEGRQAAWHKQRFGAGNETSIGSQGIPQGSPSTPPVYRRRGGQTDAGYQAQQTSLDPVIARALRLTAPERPMVALADLFQRQLRGRPPS